MKPDVKNTFGIYDPYNGSPGRHYYAVQFDTVENLIRMTNTPSGMAAFCAVMIRIWDQDTLGQKALLLSRAEGAVRRAIKFRTTGDFKS